MPLPGHHALTPHCQALQGKPQVQPAPIHTFLMPSKPPFRNSPGGNWSWAKMSHTLLITALFIRARSQRATPGPVIHVHLLRRPRHNYQFNKYPVTGVRIKKKISKFSIMLKAKENKYPKNLATHSLHNMIPLVHKITLGFIPLSPTHTQYTARFLEAYLPLNTDGSYVMRNFYLCFLHCLHF